MDGIPLLSGINTELIPLDLINPDGDLAELLSGVVITDYTETTNADESVTAQYSLSFSEEVSFAIVGLDGFELVFGGGSDPTVIVGWTGGSEDGYVIYLLGGIQLRFKNNLFIPVVESGGIFIPDPDNEYLSISLSAGIEMDQDVAFTFTGGNSFALNPVMIGYSGVVIEGEIAFDFSENEALPESLALGLSESWKGAIFKTISIHLPDSINVPILPGELNLEDFYIGNGGITGSISGNWTNSFNVSTGSFTGDGIGDIFGIAFALQEIDISFQQNTVTAGAIRGSLKLPFFEEILEVEVGLTNSGDFTLAVSDTDGLLTLEKEGIISIEVTSLEFIKEENSFSIKLSGTVTPLLAGFDWPSFELKGLTISSDGTVQVEGGWIELPDLKALDFHGFKIEIAKLGFGSDEEQGTLYKWISFSGGIQIINELPMRGGVEGLKVMWGIDGVGNLLVKLKIGGVYLSFAIEDVLTFDGSVYFIDEPDKKEFRGGVDLNLIPINLGIDAQFITGRTEDYNYFYIFIGLELPVGIPLGPTALGLYGFAGLYGHNMTLDYQKLIDYEDVDSRPDLSDISNWYNRKGALAFGAGLTIGTLPDTKFTVKAKALFVILIPGPVLLIEGHVGILSTGENFLMRVLAVLDVAAGTFLMNISATYAFPKESGELLDIAGSAEAFFSAGDPDSWHLYLGENKPESKRIRADILSFFKAQTYLMVDHEDLLMGAWIGYGLDKKYGILHVVLEAWMSGELGLSLMPIQAKGSITLYGNAELSASIVSLGISVEANVTAEAPKPLYIEASLEVQLKTPLGKPKAKIKLKWEKPGEPSYPIPLSLSLGIEHRKVTKNWDLTKSSEYAIDNDGLYDESKPPVVNAPQVPLVAPDVYLVLNFDKPMEDGGPVGNNPAPSPAVEVVGNYDFKYALDSVLLEYRDEWDENIDNGPWFNYEEFAESQVQNGQSAFSLSGTWQVIPDTDKIENTKLVLNASTPFEISRVLENAESWWGLVDLYNPEYPCTGTAVEEQICVDFETSDFGYYYGALVENEFVFTSPYPMNILGYRAPWLGTEKGMNNGDSYQTIECLNIKAQEETERIDFKVVDNVLITAGIGYDSYLKFTDEFSNDSIELFVNDSVIDVGKMPSFIHFPELHFENLPYMVWVTCIVDVGDNTFLFALDIDGNVLDEVQINEGTMINGATVYKLESGSLPIRKIGMIGSGIRIIEICYAKYHRVEASVILVTAPEDIVKAEIHLSKSSNGNIIIYNKENTEFESITFDIPENLPDDEVQPVILEVDTNTFRSFLITGQYKIIRICSVTEEAHETYLNNAGLDTHLQTSLEENWGRHTAQILHPNKYYRLTVNTTTSRRKNEGDWAPKTFTEFMYFKTGNPPGPPVTMQLNTPETERYDLEEPLKDLSAYINYSIPAGAAADVAQKLIYRSYDIGVVYDDSYIDQMYQMAGLPIKIKLLDNNNLPVLNSSGDVLELSNLWGDNPELSQTREEQHYQDMLDESGCVVIATTVTIESNNEIIASSRDLLLLPRIQYKAQVIAGENTPIYEFTFLTSRYANFIHLIHSFDHVIWNHFELLQDTAYELDEHILELILDNEEDEHVQFEQVMGFFGLYPRVLPERTEIMLMNDRNQSYGFLLETSEPFDWNRTTLEVTFTEKINAVEEHFSSLIRIVGGSSADITLLNNNRIAVDYNSQWIDILLLESIDLKDYTLEYEINPGEGVFQQYYSFKGGLLNAGTMIRVFNGVNPESLLETEYISYYSEHQSNLSSANGRIFRLCDPDGGVVTMFVLYNSNLFNTVTSRIIRNEDGTRLFFFVTSGSQPFSQLDAGTYQLLFNYNRDIGSSQPLLKRFGFIDSEETAIQFIMD